LMFTQIISRSVNLSTSEFLSTLISDAIVSPIGEIRFSTSIEQGVHVNLKATVYSSKASVANQNDKAT
jgi:hypothetical protein